MGTETHQREPYQGGPHPVEGMSPRLPQEIGRSTCPRIKGAPRGTGLTDITRTPPGQKNHQETEPECLPPASINKDGDALYDCRPVA